MTLSFDVKRAARRWIKPVAFWVLLAPGLFLVWKWVGVWTYDPSSPAALDVLVDPFFVDPVGVSHVILGDTALRVLLVSLAMTPLRDWTGWGGWILVRRRVGLFAFGYALAHLAVYFGVELSWSLAKLAEDIGERRYITVGMAALVLLIPLAITSHNRLIRALGPVIWRRLHWLVYPIAVLAVTHHVWVEKGVQLEPLVHAGVLAVLLGHRVVRGVARGVAGRAWRR